MIRMISGPIINLGLTILSAGLALIDIGTALAIWGQRLEKSAPVKRAPKKTHPNLTISLSLNCELSDRSKHQTFMLPLAWLTMPLDGWQRLARQVQAGLSNALLGPMVWGAG